MGKKAIKRPVSRRAVLKTVGASGILGGVLSSSAQAVTIHSYSGTREREFTPDSSGDYWTQESWFTSSELGNDYGTDTFNVSTDSPLPRNAIPTSHKNPDDTFTVSYSESVKIAEFQEWETKQQDSGYTGPRFAFKTNKSTPSPSDLAEPQAPLNLGWTWGTASEIENTWRTVAGTLDGRRT